MTSIEVQHDAAASPARIWDMLQDFGNIEAWWPRGGEPEIERVVNEGEGIGMIRHIHNVGMPAPVSERLDFLDRDNWTWKLSIVCDRPAGIRQYQATGTIEDLGNGRSRIRYRGEFEAEPGREDEARDFLARAYALMFRGIDAAVART